MQRLQEENLSLKTDVQDLKSKNQVSDSKFEGYEAKINALSKENHDLKEENKGKDAKLMVLKKELDTQKKLIGSISNIADKRK